MRGGLATPSNIHGQRAHGETSAWKLRRKPSCQLLPTAFDYTCVLLIGTGVLKSECNLRLTTTTHVWFRCIVVVFRRRLVGQLTSTRLDKASKQILFEKRNKQRLGWPRRTRGSRFCFFARTLVWGSLTRRLVYSKKYKYRLLLSSSGGEIEDFVETLICKLFVILRSRVLLGCVSS